MLAPERERALELDSLARRQSSSFPFWQGKPCLGSAGWLGACPLTEEVAGGWRPGQVGGVTIGRVSPGLRPG